MVDAAQSQASTSNARNATKSLEQRKYENSEIKLCMVSISIVVAMPPFLFTKQTSAVVQCRGSERFSRVRVMDKKNNVPNCPSCQDSRQVKEIIYGRPSQELYEEAQKGNVVLGGCCPEPGIKFICKKCDKKF